jgi:hypothetical protein
MGQRWQSLTDCDRPNKLTRRAGAARRVAAPEGPAGGSLYFFTADAVFRFLRARGKEVAASGLRAAGGGGRGGGGREGAGAFDRSTLAATQPTPSSPTGRPAAARTSERGPGSLPSFLRGSPAPSAFAVPRFEQGSPFLPRSGGKEGPAVLFWLGPLCRASVLNGSDPPIWSEIVRARPYRSPEAVDRAATRASLPPVTLSRSERFAQPRGRAAAGAPETTRSLPRNVDRR